MFNLFDIAYASTSGNGAVGGMGSTIIMIVAMVAIFYFLLIRPENKRKKEAEAMRSSLKKGDWLTTIGGVYGRVVSITDRTVVIETSEDRVRIEFLKSAIGNVGTLDEQAAAQQRAPKFGKKDEPADEEKKEDSSDEA
jgi:preprotein translocase subunit YajC